MDSIPVSTPRTSGSAIASLVCGLLGCIPFATGLAAVILGIVGIRKTRDPMVTGRGMAIAGLVLGSLSLAGWAIGAVAIGGGVWAIYQAAEPARLTAEEFTRDLGEGKVDAALALSAEGTDRAALEALSERMKPWGACQKLGLTTINLDRTKGMTQFTIGGTATFANETRTYSMTLSEAGGSYKVVNYEFP